MPTGSLSLAVCLLGSWVPFPGCFPSFYHFSKDRSQSTQMNWALLLRTCAPSLLFCCASVPARASCTCSRVAIVAIVADILSVPLRASPTRVSGWHNCHSTWEPSLCACSRLFSASKSSDFIFNVCRRLASARRDEEAVGSISQDTHFTQIQWSLFSLFHPALQAIFSMRFPLVFRSESRGVFLVVLVIWCCLPRMICTMFLLLLRNEGCIG